MRAIRIGMVQHPIDLLGGTSRAASCIDPALKRYAVARDVDIARQAFAVALRKWLCSVNETATALAVRCGIKRVTVYGWLAGAAMPSPENSERLRAAGFDANDRKTP